MYEAILGAYPISIDTLEGEAMQSCTRICPTM